MRKNHLIKLTLIILFIMNSQISWCTVIPKYNGKPKDQYQIFINKSSYSLDQKLIDRGFTLKNDNNNLILYYQNNPIPAAQFYATCIGCNKAIKLYISLKDTIKNASIFLNDHFLGMKTDKTGMALLDRSFKEGNFHLMLRNKTTSLNYYFMLDKDLKLNCTGISALKCQKEYY